MPVVGNKFVFTPAWINVWNINNDAKPLKENFKILLSWLKQFLIILKEMYKNIIMIIIEIKEPYYNQESGFSFSNSDMEVVSLTYSLTNFGLILDFG